MKNIESIVYTIIIPHYNMPKLLRRCLSSIPLRDDLQVIVVDDKSNDENIILLKELECIFSYVSFYYSDVNGGGGRARNIGLSHAEGKYVLFADGDDFFNYCINDILDEYKDSDYDAVFFNVNHIDTETYLATKRGSTLQRAVSMYAKDGNMDAFRYVFGEPWCKMIKREIIDNNEIRFDEIPIHNDTKFSYLVGYYSKKTKFDNRAIYCLADRLHSVSKDLTDEKYAIRVKVFAEKNRFLKDRNIKYFDNFMIRPFWVYAKHCDTENFKRCLVIAGEYGFSKYFVIKKLSSFVIKIILKRVKK